ncbi:hypothetical protein ACVIIV_000154 [Bradyrhizobium sp. USDA 4354]
MDEATTTTPALRQALEPGGEVWCIADGRVLLRRISADEVADHHKPGRNCDPQLSPFAGACFELAYSGDHVEARAHRALRVIFVGTRIAEIDEYSVTDESGYPAVISSDHARAGGAIGPNHFPHILGIEARRESGGADQIAKHNGEVAPLGVLRGSGRCDQCGWIEVGDSTQYSAAMAEQDSELLKVLVHQFGKDAYVDPILGKRLCVLPKPQLLEPLRNLHGSHRSCGWRLAEFWTTARGQYTNATMMARLVCCAIT